MKLLYLRSEKVKSLADFLDGNDRRIEILSAIVGEKPDDIKKWLKEGTLYDEINEKYGWSDNELIEEVLSVEEQGQNIAYTIYYNEHGDYFTIQAHKVCAEDVIRDMADDILIANWFDRADLEELLDREVSPKNTKPS